MSRHLLLLPLLVACTGSIGDEGDGGISGFDSSFDSSIDGEVEVPCGEAGAAILFLERRCARCHQGSRAYPDLTREGLPRLVELMSEGMPGERLLVPGDPTASWLYRKMSFTQDSAGGAGMPLGLDGPVEELAQIEAWIMAGAPTSCDELAPPDVPYDPNALDPVELFTCADPAAPRSSPARIRRIDDREFNASAIGRADTNPLAPPAGSRYSTYAGNVSIEPSTLRLLMAQFPRATRAWTVSDPQQVGSTRMFGVNIGCIAGDGDPSEECIDDYIDALFVRGAAFRSPSPDEYGRLRALLVDALGNEASESIPRVETLELVSQAARLSTASLFRGELGESSEARRILTPDELGLALAHLIAAEGPGVPLHRDPSAGAGWSAEDPDLDNQDGGRLGHIRAAVEDGSIMDPAARIALFRRYAGGIAGERRPDLNLRSNNNVARGEYWLNTNLIQFFREWFDYTDANTVFKQDESATSGFEDDDTGPSFGELRSSWNGTEGTLTQQLDDMIARIVVETDAGAGDVFNELMTSSLYHLPSNLGSGGSIPCASEDDCPDTGATRCPNTGFCSGSVSRYHVWKQAVFGLRENVGLERADRWLSMERRRGVLTHPAWLAAHGGNFEDDASLVERGNWIRSQLFCQSFGTLDDVQGLVAMLPAQPEEAADLLSARARVFQATESEETEGASACFGCHQYMNSLGNPFEAFNHAGFERAYDHGGDVDGSTVVDNLPDAALNRAYANPLEFVEALGGSAYARRGFVRHAFRFFMGRDEVLGDSCTLVEMEDALERTGSFFSMLEALLMSETFTHRRDTDLDEGGSR